MLKCDLMKNGKCVCTTKCAKLIWYEQGRADERKAFEDIEMGLSKEDKRRVLADFGNWLEEEGYDSSCHNIKAWITEYENRDKKEQK